MIGRSEFTEGLTRIGIAVRQPADAATMGVYFDALRNRVGPEEWLRFVAWSLDPCRWRYGFPRLAAIQDALREFSGDRPVLIEATQAYEAVLASGEYTAEAGTSWTYRRVRERCGEAAAEAFLAAGGTSAFVQTWDEAKRRERFIEAYGEAVRENPDGKLLPAGPKALPSGDARPLTHAEAKEIMGQVRAAAPAVRVKANRVIATEDRLAELRRQVDVITAERAEKVEAER